MSELVSMLVPLQTLPGWPEAPAVSPLQAIGLLVVLPLIVIVIITTIGQVGHRVAASRPRPAWEEHAVGSRTDPGSLGGSGAGAALPAGRSAEGAESEASGAGEAEEAQPQTQQAGGVSARW